MPCGTICTNICIGEFVIDYIKKNATLPPSRSVWLCTGKMAAWHNFWEEYRSTFSGVSQAVVGTGVRYAAVSDS
jgi:hypothetical protein